MRIPIQQIIWDITERTNPDTSDLLKSMMKFGQLEPLVIEGPNEKSQYYVIHGLRRIMAMKLRPDLFKEVDCGEPRSISTPEHRNVLRLLMASHNKRHTGLDQQLIYEDINEDYNRDELVPKKTIKRMNKGIDVPQELRQMYEKKRRSQDALETIYFLDCDEKYRKVLMDRLYNGLITCDHGDAIKRVIANPLYSKLSFTQRRNVLEMTLKKAKFTKNDAAFVIFEEIMKHSPDSGNVSEWFEYISDELGRVSDLIHSDLVSMVSVTDKESLRLAYELLSQKVQVIIKTEAQKLDRKVDPVLKIEVIKKQIIMIEKRDGNTISFRYQDEFI